MEKITFLWRDTRAPAPLAPLVPTPMLTSQDLSLMYKSWIHPALEYGNILYAGGDIIYNGLIVYSLKLSGPVAHTFNHYFIIIMHQLLDWFVISMLVRDEEFYRIIAHYFMVLTILIASLPIYMAGILLHICA